jgi:hypothetical protein
MGGQLVAVHVGAGSAHNVAIATELFTRPEKVAPPTRAEASLTTPTWAKRWLYDEHESFESDEEREREYVYMDGRAFDMEIEDDVYAITEMLSFEDRTRHDGGVLWSDVDVLEQEFETAFEREFEDRYRADYSPESSVPAPPIAAQRSSPKEATSSTSGTTVTAPTHVQASKRLRRKRKPKRVATVTESPTSTDTPTQASPPTTPNARSTSNKDDERRQEVVEKLARLSQLTSSLRPGNVSSLSSLLSAFLLCLEENVSTEENSREL